MESKKYFTEMRHFRHTYFHKQKWRKENSSSQNEQRHGFGKIWEKEASCLLKQQTERVCMCVCVQVRERMSYTFNC